MAENSIKPRIRFKGYTDAWEQRKFSELANTRRGLTYSPTNIAEKGVRVLRSSNINEDVFTLSEDDVFVCQNAVNIEYVHEHEILITAANGSTRLVGKHAIIIGIPEKSAVHGGFMLIAAAKSPFFLNASMSAPWYAKFISLFVAGGNGAIGNLNKNDLDGQNVYVPLETEQIRIGEFFKQLDNLITLHQRKYDKFVNIKKALLEKMFPQGNEMTPKIRFKGFTDAWEQRKAETLFITYAEKGYPELPVLSATQDKGMVFRDDTGKIIFHDESNEIGYKRVQPGQFVIHLRSFQGGFAHSAILGITSPAYTIFGFKEGEKQSDLYWKYVFNSPEFIRRLETVTYGIRDGRSISYDEFLTMKFVIPKYEEQIKIAGYLSKVDNLITLHQREHRQKKNPFLNENRSLFREAIANAWEQRKLGEVANIQKGQQLGKAEMSNNGAFYVLNGGMEPSGYTNQYNTFANTISISEGGNSCGYVSLNLEQFWSGGHNYTLQNPRIDTFFLYQWLKRHEKGIMALRVGSGLPNIQKSALQDVIVAYPKKSEQRAIAEILNKIDNLITLHQRQLEKLKNIKSALLEKMFV